LRGWGRTFDGLGKAMQGDLAYTEKMGAHRSVRAFEASQPAVSNGFIAPSASVIGDVALGAGSSIWYGAVLRGDVNTIKVGANSHIGDRSVVHVASESGSIGTGARPTIIGDGVTVGPLSILHACTIGSGAQIGTGAQVLDGASVGDGAVVEAGAVVSPGKAVPAGEVWGGVPAKMVRKVSQDEALTMTRANTELGDLAQAHAAENTKSWAEVEADKEEAHDAATRDVDYNPEYYGDASGIKA